MKKAKINTFCGNEFTVFYLKDDSRGYDDPSHPLNKHDADAKYNISSYTLPQQDIVNLNWMDVNENSAGGGAGFSFKSDSQNN